MSPMRDGRTDERTTSKDSATQLLICEPLSLAIQKAIWKTTENLLFLCETPTVTCVLS